MGHIHQEGIPHHKTKRNTALFKFLLQIWRRLFLLGRKLNLVCFITHNRSSAAAFHTTWGRKATSGLLLGRSIFSCLPSVACFITSNRECNCFSATSLVLLCFSLGTKLQLGCVSPFCMYLSLSLYPPICVYLQSGGYCGLEAKLGYRVKPCLKMSYSQTY